MQVFKHNKANKPLFTCCEADLKLESTLDQDGNYEIIMIPCKHLDEFSSFFADEFFLIFVGNQAKENYQYNNNC